MSKKDKKKELLAEIRRWQNYCITIFIAVVAFVATQYDTINNILLWLCGGVIVLSIIVIIVLAIKIHKIIDDIGRL